MYNFFSREVTELFSIIMCELTIIVISTVYPKTTAAFTTPTLKAFFKIIAKKGENSSS